MVLPSAWGKMCVYSHRVTVRLIVHNYNLQCIHTVHVIMGCIYMSCHNGLCVYNVYTHSSCHNVIMAVHVIMCSLASM